MDTVFYLLGPLLCAAMMGVMMWTMRRHGSSTADPDHDTRRELAALRAEVTRLRAGQTPTETRTPAGR